MILLLLKLISNLLLGGRGYPLYLTTFSHFLSKGQVSCLIRNSECLYSLQWLCMAQRIPVLAVLEVAVQKLTRTISCSNTVVILLIMFIVVLFKPSRPLKATLITRTLSICETISTPKESFTSTISTLLGDEKQQIVFLLKDTSVTRGTRTTL